MGSAASFAYASSTLLDESVARHPMQAAASLSDTDSTAEHPLKVEGVLSDNDGASVSTSGGTTAACSREASAQLLDRSTTAGNSAMSTVEDGGLGSDTASDTAPASRVHAIETEPQQYAAAVGPVVMEPLPGLAVVPWATQFGRNSRRYVPAAPRVPRTPVVPPLHRAAAEGDVATVVQLLMQGFDPNEEDMLLGETPLFEAAAVDAAPAVALLLLFGADTSRRGRHTTAVASEFAPAGGPTAELLSAWENGNRRALLAVLMPALHVAAARGCGEAGHMARTLQAEATGRWSGAVFSAATCDTAPGEPYTLPQASPALAVVLADLRSRMVEPQVPHRLLSAGSAAAQALWAMVTACDPQAALSVLPSTSTSLAKLLLGDANDAAWERATACVAGDVAARDRRRRGADGQPVSWRSTFQELVTQRVFCWGTDGVITGFGARAPVKVYSRPRALQLEPRMQPFVKAIACGRRHSAAVTFCGSVYVWGRDVAPAVPPPEEARAGLDAWHAWRATQGRFTTSSDRPRRLVLTPASSSKPPDTVDTVDTVDVVSLSATHSMTVLRLGNGRTVSTGGWNAQEAQLPERMAEAMEAKKRAPRLPPLRRITRGFCFNVALSRDGRVFVWRHSGLVPTGIIETVPVEPTSILPPGTVAADIAVGEGHILILTEQGRVWSFGWRQLSALGRGARLGTASAILPSPIDGLERIVQISAGATYSLCVDVDGCLWLFGEGPCITGCFDSPDAVHEPRRVPSSVFGGRSVLAASCGDGHVLALTAWDPCRRLLQPGAWFADGDHGDRLEPDDAMEVVGEWTP